MQGNFSYYNPTKLYFGKDSLNFLKEELKNYGNKVLLNYGSGSVKRNGIYDQVMAILREAGKTIVENPGVMTNPTLSWRGLTRSLEETFSSIKSTRTEYTCPKRWLTT